MPELPDWEQELFRQSYEEKSTSPTGVETAQASAESSKSLLAKEEREHLANELSEVFREGFMNPMETRVRGMKEAAAEVGKAIEKSTLGWDVKPMMPGGIVDPSTQEVRSAYEQLQTRFAQKRFDTFVEVAEGVTSAKSTERDISMLSLAQGALKAVLERDYATSQEAASAIYTWYDQVSGTFRNYSQRIQNASSSISQELRSDSEGALRNASDIATGCYASLEKVQYQDRPASSLLYGRSAAWSFRDHTLTFRDTVAEVTSRWSKAEIGEAARVEDALSACRLIRDRFAQEYVTREAQEKN